MEIVRGLGLGPGNVTTKGVMRTIKPALLRLLDADDAAAVAAATATAGAEDARAIAKAVSLPRWVLDARARARETLTTAGRGRVARGHAAAVIRVIAELMRVRRVYGARDIKQRRRIRSLNSLLYDARKGLDSYGVAARIRGDTEAM